MQIWACDRCHQNGELKRAEREVQMIVDGKHESADLCNSCFDIVEKTMNEQAMSNIPEAT